ncbi:MAG: 4Fe-4S binding protein [Planctomycetes bacterium]|nr:4Fe-4S binding protein [Planctomycetota bacterium]
MAIAVRGTDKSVLREWVSVGSLTTRACSDGLENAMQSGSAYLRDINRTAVPDHEVQALAEMLTGQPIEVLLTGRGAVVPPATAGPGRQLVEQGRRAAVALARRNVRSLLCGTTKSDLVASSLATALTAPARDAEDALEDASLVVNLRYSIHAGPDAAILLDGRSLVITDGAATPVRIARRALRGEGTSYFCKDALARLAGLDIDDIRLSPGAVAPLYLQLEPGAVMGPDTAHQHLHKGGWRAIRKADFVKDYCVACGRCFIHCPDNAIIHAMYDPHARDTTGILGIDTERCTACGLCAAVCPPNHDGYKAIVMVSAESPSSAELHCVG